ncbi:DUF2957 domain-containing protein [Paraburkholderia sp. MMS20-SJTR3]|uniref:DUF2957 domain-containing protein n=1 Tax=Paraburkholderia sejongensis TaxID=2886946 RepID=A0ABS8JT74_9BURK|nr:DUF2957 domain-containing protein [Paraburkholderia sp. MMS20-SJTR3]MCC8393111.1 DUF2957 domain-containing protein [Paraburkholderia sp. MMS20-SJTR3]
MSHAMTRGLAMAIAAAPILIACGGGKAGDPSPVTPTQCSGVSCGPQGAPASSATTATLCPATADIVKSKYLGGAGSGEVVQLNIDATAMTYTLKWLESPIPLTSASVSVTRKGTQIAGPVIHPPAGMLPTDEQTRCAFILGAGSGTASNGTTYTTPSFVNNPNPPMVLVGKGVAGGGIPGATVEYAGINLVVTTLGAVTKRHFDFYPFLGFASTTTDLSRLPGTYNALLYHLSPTANYETIATNAVETFDASGNCTSSSSTGCLSTGKPLTLNSNGYFDSSTPPQIVPGTGAAANPLRTGNFGTAHMILGQLNGATVPLVVRTGLANPDTLQVDDESGIAMLAAATPLASGGFDGGYVGADSNFKYTATLVQGAAATFINPSTSAPESTVGLGYGASTPGLVNVLDGNGHTGLAIASGGLYATVIQGSENGGIASTSANPDTPSAPYFGIGAQISK